MGTVYKDRRGSTILQVGEALIITGNGVGNVYQRPIPFVGTNGLPVPTPWNSGELIIGPFPTQTALILTVSDGKMDYRVMSADEYTVRYGGNGGGTPFDFTAAFQAYAPTLIKPILDARGEYRPVVESEFPKEAGETDDTGFIKRAHLWARKNRTTVRGIPNRQYVISDPIPVATAYSGWLAQGSGYLQTVAGKACLSVDNTPLADDVPIDAGIGHAFRANEIRPWDGFVLYGPGRAANGSIAMDMKNPSAGAMFTNFKIDEFDLAWNWDDKAYIQHFDKFSVTHVNKLGIFAGLTGWDAGERLSWSNGTFSNSNGGFDFARMQAYFHNISMDYLDGSNGNWLNLSSGADAFFNQSHLEGNQVDAYWGRATGGSSINFMSSTLIASGTPTGKNPRSTPFFDAEVSSRSMINFIGINRIGATGATGRNGYGTMKSLVSGGGRSDTWIFYNPGIPIPPSHTGNNLINDAGAGTSALRSFKNRSTTATAVVTTATSGAKSISGASREHQPALGQKSDHELLITVNPQSQIFFGFDAIQAGSPTENFYVIFDFRTVDGEVAGDGTLTIAANSLSTDATAPTVVRAQPSILTPPAAATCRIALNKATTKDGTSNGVGSVIVDNFLLTGSNISLVPAAHSGFPGWNVRQVAVSGVPINVDEIIYVDTSAGAVALTGLNGVIREGSRIRFVDKANTFATNNFTWTPPAAGVRGSTTPIVMNVNGQSNTYEYNGTTFMQV